MVPGLSSPSVWTLQILPVPVWVPSFLQEYKHMQARLTAYLEVTVSRAPPWLCVG